MRGDKVRRSVKRQALSEHDSMHVLFIAPLLRHQVQSGRQCNLVPNKESVFHPHQYPSPLETSRKSFCLVIVHFINARYQSHSKGTSKYIPHKLATHEVYKTAPILHRIRLSFLSHADTSCNQPHGQSHNPHSGNAATARTQTNS